MRNFIFLAVFILLISIGYGATSTPTTTTYTVSAPLVTVIDYKGTSNPVYVGRAAAGAITTDAMWQVEYITYNGSGNALTVQWSPNYKTFGDIWSSHDSLVYS